MTDLDLMLLRRRTSRLLAPWDHTGTPGVTLGVVRNDHLVVHESAGMASVRHASRSSRRAASFTTKETEVGTSEKVSTEITMTNSRKLVPQRGCRVL